METLLGVIKTALPVFLALGLGVLCRRKNLLNREGINALKKVAVDIALPAVMFSAFATAEYTVTSLILPGIMYAFCCGALVIGTVALKIGKNKSRLARFLTTGFEAGMLGYALFVL